MTFGGFFTVRGSSFQPTKVEKLAEKFKYTYKSQGDTISTKGKQPKVA